MCVVSLTFLVVCCFLEADVVYLRGDDDNKDNWNPAAVNLPAQSGDSFYTNPQSRAEVQFGQDGLVRLGNGAYVGVLQNSDDRFQMKLTVGCRLLLLWDSNRFARWYGCI
jgi:hypothetical protein